MTRAVAALIALMAATTAASCGTRGTGAGTGAAAGAGAAAGVPATGPSALELRLSRASSSELPAIVDGLSAADLETVASGSGPAAALAKRRRDAIEAHRTGVARKPGAAAVVVALLPLSGPHRALGIEIRGALEVARADARLPSLVFVDTLGTEAGARAAVATAVSRHKATVLIGPVGSRESRSAAAAAVARGVVIGLLSPEETGAAPREGVFRLWPSREAEAVIAARTAVELGHEAPAVLAPRDELGRAQAEAFARAARQAGASEVVTGFYDPTATSLESDLKTFLGLVPAENERLRRHLRRYGRKKGWKTFSPDVPFDLLYIPDRYDRAALVASFLPFFNVELRAGDIVDTLALRRKHGGRLPSVVQLLGSSEWHHPSLFARGRDAVDGALLLDHCIGGPGEDYLDDVAAAIAGRLRRRLGRTPSRLAREAYDAGRLVFDRVVAIKRAGPSLFTGATLRAGACGPARVGHGGQLRRQPTLLRVDVDELVPHEW